MRHLGVLGSPIAHSLSPTIQLAAFHELGLDWSYEAIEVREGELESFVRSCDSTWQGVSLTMPLKAEAISACDEVDLLALQVNAANTITWTASKTHAHNTDVLGFFNALELHEAIMIESVTILGGGATARAAVAAVSKFAANITVYVRNPSREESLFQAKGDGHSTLQIARWDQVQAGLKEPLVISTTPRGVTDVFAHLVPQTPGILFESLYAPWPTALVSQWERNGGRVLSGLDLLVEQGIEQLKLFDPKMDLPDVSKIRRVMLDAGRVELARRNSIALVDVHSKDIQ